MRNFTSCKNVHVLGKKWNRMFNYNIVGIYNQNFNSVISFRECIKHHIAKDFGKTLNLHTIKLWVHVMSVVNNDSDKGVNAWCSIHVISQYLKYAQSTYIRLFNDYIIFVVAASFLIDNPRKFGFSCSMSTKKALNPYRTYRLNPMCELWSTVSPLANITK